MLRDQSLNVCWDFMGSQDFTGLEWCRNDESGPKLLYAQTAPSGHWLGNMVKLLQPYMLQHGEMTEHPDLESELGWVLYITCIAKDHSGAPDFVLCELLILWLSDDIYHPLFISCRLYSSKAPRDSAFAYYFSLHTFALAWFFLSLWCQPPFLCWWYAYICLWFLTSFLFLCLAGIKSLMFQYHIQLKLCKTEFLVMSSLKSEIIQFSLFIWPLLTSNSLQTGIQGVIFDW